MVTNMVRKRGKKKQQDKPTINTPTLAAHGSKL